jgi:hypothetical protein
MSQTKHAFKFGDKVRCHDPFIGEGPIYGPIYEIIDIDVTYSNEPMLRLRGVPGRWFALRFSPAIPEFDPITLGM